MYSGSLLLAAAHKRSDLTAVAKPWRRHFLITYTWLGSQAIMCGESFCIHPHLNLSFHDHNVPLQTNQTLSLFLATGGWENLSVCKWSLHIRLDLLLFSLLSFFKSLSQKKRNNYFEPQREWGWRRFAEQMVEITFGGALQNNYTYA